MSTKTELAEMFWNCSVIALLVCVLQALSYFWLVSLYNFKLDMTRSLHCSGCFDVGVGLTALGVFLMLFQECGLTFGTMGTLASIIFMLENIKSVEKNTNTIESGLGALLVPTLGCLLFTGKAIKSVGGVQEQEPLVPTQDEPDNVHMKSEPRGVENKGKTPTKMTEAWTFISTQVDRLTTTSLWGPCKKAGALLAVFSCFVLTYTVASRESGLAVLCVALQVLSCFWLISLFDLNTHNPKVANFFFFGVGGTLLGPLMLFIPLIGFSLFSFFYSAGTVCTLISMMFLTGQTVSIEHAVTRLIKWIKTKVGTIDPDASKWETYSDIFASDIGGIAEGLCALLFPALGLLLGIVHVVMWALGLGGQKKKTPPVKDATNQQKQGNERDTELDEFQHMVMKVLRFVILGAILWFWGFALFLWTSSCLLFGVFHCLHHKSANIGFIVCFIIGAFCTVLGVYLLDQPVPGLTLFSVFYTVGNLCVLGSTLFVVELWEQLKLAFDRARAMSSSVMILCLLLTFAAALWWKSFIVALTFCFLHILSSIWYCLTYVQYNRRVFTFLELSKEE